MPELREFQQTETAAGPLLSKPKCPALRHLWVLSDRSLTVQTPGPENTRKPHRPADQALGFAYLYGLSRVLHWRVLSCLLLLWFLHDIPVAAQELTGTESAAHSAKQVLTKQAIEEVAKRMMQSRSREYQRIPENTPAAVPGGSAISLQDTAPSLSAPIREKWAIVIGISKFADPEVQLRYGSKDARDFANYLVSSAGFAADHVRLLTDEQATRENIYAQLGERWLGRRARPDDLVVVYVSSHGTAMKREVAGVDFLVAYDTNPNNLLGTGIPMEWFCQIIKDQVHCERLVLFLDACHGAAVAHAAKGLRRDNPFDAARLALSKGQIVIASSQADQESWESKNYPNSVFTRRLLEGLQLHGKQTTLTAAFGYLQDKVQDEVLRDRAQLQTPIMRKFWTGSDLMLAVPSKRPQ